MLKMIYGFDNFLMKKRQEKLAEQKKKNKKDNKDKNIYVFNKSFFFFFYNFIIILPFYLEGHPTKPSFYFKRLIIASQMGLLMKDERAPTTEVSLPRAKFGGLDF